MDIAHALRKQCGQPIYRLRGRLRSTSKIMETKLKANLTQSFNLSKLAICVGAFLCTNALAQTPQASVVEKIPAIIVTANRWAEPLAETLAQATVITRDDIDAAPAATLAELLQRRAGVEIRATGGSGQPSSVFIRGANSTHTLVLIDGQRVGSSTTGSTAFEALALDNIERIEVVKGPRSGLYGADAIGGVIQIFTRNAATKGTAIYANMGGGSYATRSLNAGVTHHIDNTVLSLAAGSQRINAPSATNAAAGSFTFNPDRDPTKNSNAKIGLLHRFGIADSVALDAWQSQSKTAFDGGTGDTDTNNRQTQTGLTFKLNNRFAPNWQSRLSVGQAIDESRITSSFSGLFKTRQDNLSWQNDMTLANTNLAIGAERRDERVSSTTAYTQSSRKTNSLFGVAATKVGEISIDANARHDRENQFGKRNTGGVSAGFKLPYAQLIYASVGTAFRAPSFNDLYFPGFSNAKLLPEKSRSSEIGWRITKNNLRANVAYFDNKIENLIAFDFVTSTPQNIQRARINGMEMAVESAFMGIDWRAQVTSQTPKNADNNKQLRSRAKTFGALSASQTIGAWRWQVDAVLNGARFDSASESAASRMAGYSLVNASVGYRVNANWQLELAANNLANKTYELARGYNQLGRQVLLNLRFSQK